MPELIEVEYYRQAITPLIGHCVDAIEIPDERYTRPRDTPVEVFDQLVGRRLTGTSRRGKLLCLSVGNDDLTLGMRFGMTGRLLIDGSGPIDKLEYSSSRDEPSWDRFTVMVNGQRVSIRDPRRLGSVELDPDLNRLGPEASTVTSAELAAAFAGRTKAAKAVLLDQCLLAGLGNLLADECLWHAGIAPSRPADALADSMIDVLASTIRTVVATLSKRGGSHCGDSFEARSDGSTCPADGGPMQHNMVGGRSTWWCPEHQE